MWSTNGYFNFKFLRTENWKAIDVSMFSALTRIQWKQMNKRRVTYLSIPPMTIPCLWANPSLIPSCSAPNEMIQVCSGSTLHVDCTSLSFIILNPMFQYASRTGFKIRYTMITATVQCLIERRGNITSNGIFNHHLSLIDCLIE